MTIYLQLNGTTDYIQLPSMALDRIVIDFKPGSLTKANEYILGDNRSGYIRNNGTTGNEDKLNYSFTVGGVASTGSNNLVLPNTRCTLDATRSSNTPSVKIGSDVSGLNNLNGAFYDIKVYSSGAIVAHYDLSNGTVQDISGNGRHATLTGGSWVDDGGGTTPTDATITGIIANASADTLEPAVSTVSSISTNIDTLVASMAADILIPSVSNDNTITSTIAGASADALNPSVSLSSNISIITVAADMTADALPPQVGSFTNISINAVVVSANADALSPSMDAVRNISVDTLIADATADALASMVGSSASVQITAVIASVTSDGIAPGVGTSQGIRIDSVVAELTVDALSPAIQTDAIISAFIADVIATGRVPIINKDAIPTYNEVIQIVLNITRKQTAALDITQREQSELKL